MGEIVYAHPEYAGGKWKEMSPKFQMGNIGSEVSRALKWQSKNKEKYMNAAIDRALELFDLTIDCYKDSPAREKEICRAREEFCSYFFGGKEIKVDPTKMLKYYDQFAMMS